MESVADMLGRYRHQGSDEVAAIKQFISVQFQASSSVTVKNDVIVVTVPSASLANTLRLRALALQEAAKTTKRLVFRIG